MTGASLARKGDVLVLLGTRKGCFILSSDQSRREWVLAGPYCAGSEVFHAVYDSREGGRVFVAVNQMVWGPEVQFSLDLGGSWSTAKEQPHFSGDDGRTVSRLWHIEPGRESEPGILYTGVEPAALFKTEDNGETWQEVPGLSDHPTRDKWQPGLGGLCLHSMVLVLSQLGFGNCLRKRLRLLPFFRSVDVGGWQPWDENGMWSGWKGKNETSWND